MLKYKSLKEFQDIIDGWITTHGGYWSPLSMMCAIVEEVGELSREINHFQGFKPKKEQSDSDLGEEFGDLLFSIICLANHYKIDLDEKLELTIDKYDQRDSTRFIKDND